MTLIRAQRRRVAVLLVGAAAAGGVLAACNPGGVSTGPCDASSCGVAWTQVYGYISSSTGQPIVGADILVHIDASRHADLYFANQVKTDESGNFTVQVVRTRDLPDPPPLDTLTMTVVGQLQEPGASPHADSTTFLARFGPTSQPAPTKQIVLHLNY